MSGTSRSTRQAPTAEERADVERLVRSALAEDIGSGDVTGTALLTAELPAQAVIIAKESGTIAGLDACAAAFQLLDAGVSFTPLISEGDRVSNPTELARLEGPARSILSSERTALNLLGRLSGVATLTASYVEAVSGTGATILDTRKTTPGLRLLEKRAVRLGGGTNHRRGLHDAILVKDTHRRLVGGAAEATRRALFSAPEGMEVTIEVESLDDVRDALEAGARRLLLDNMDVSTLSEAVRLIDGRAVTEASGGVRLDTVRAIAESGVDFISVGALTHSARCLDVSLEVTQ